LILQVAQMARAHTVKGGRYPAVRQEGRGALSSRAFRDVADFDAIRVHPHRHHRADHQLSAQRIAAGAQRGVHAIENDGEDDDVGRRGSVEIFQAGDVTPR